MDCTCSSAQARNDKVHHVFSGPFAVPFQDSYYKLKVRSKLLSVQQDFPHNIINDCFGSCDFALFNSRPILLQSLFKIHIISWKLDQNCYPCKGDFPHNIINDCFGSCDIVLFNSRPIHMGLPFGSVWHQENMNFITWIDQKNSNLNWFVVAIDYITHTHYYLYILPTYTHISVNLYIMFILYAIASDVHILHAKLYLKQNCPFPHCKSCICSVFLLLHHHIFCFARSQIIKILPEFYSLLVKCLVH